MLQLWPQLFLCHCSCQMVGQLIYVHWYHQWLRSSFSDRVRLHLLDLYEQRMRQASEGRNQPHMYCVVGYVSWVLTHSTNESFHCFWKCDRNSGRRFCRMVCPKFWVGYYLLICTHHWELMKSVGSHDSLLMLFMMKKVMVWHFVRNSWKVMTELIKVCVKAVVQGISLQFHGYVGAVCCLVVMYIILWEEPITPSGAVFTLWF